MYFKEYRIRYTVTFLLGLWLCWKELRQIYASGMVPGTAPCLNARASRKWVHVRLKPGQGCELCKCRFKQTFGSTAKQTESPVPAGQCCHERKATHESHPSKKQCCDRHVPVPSPGTATRKGPEPSNAQHGFYRADASSISVLNTVLSSGLGGVSAKIPSPWTSKSGHSATKIRISIQLIPVGDSTSKPSASKHSTLNCEHII